MERRLLAVATVLAAGLLGAADARAKAGPFSGTVERPGSTVTESWQGYGNSIMAGYCGIACQRDSYLIYYAEAASGALDATIHYDSDAVSGHLTTQVRDQMSTSELPSADAVIWSAGGNDFLDARGDFRGSCDVAALEAALGIDRSTGLPMEPHQGWVADWDSLIGKVEANVSPGARVRTMNIYYPGVNDDLSRSCGSTSHFQTFLPLLLAAGDYMCSTAWERGYDCADTIWAMNCDMGTIDDCPTTYAEWFSLGGDQFSGNFGDPRALGKLISDDTHPNERGHRDIAAAHNLLGY